MANGELKMAPEPEARSRCSSECEPIVSELLQNKHFVDSVQQRLGQDGGCWGKGANTGRHATCH